MAITLCTVSGTLNTPAGAALTNATIKANITTPFAHTDGTMILAYEVSTTTDSTGAWSMPLIETTTITKTMTIAFDYPDGTGQPKRKEYTVIIPNSASATFASLITGQL